MFADCELIGIPHRVVIGDRSLDKGEVEYRARSDTDNSMIPLQDIISHIKNQLSGELSA